MRKRHKLSAGRHMQASLCSLPTMRVTQNTLTCNVSAQEPSTQGFIGTHCLAYIKIPDSRRNCLQSRHSEPLLTVREEWKHSLNPSAMPLFKTLKWLTIHVVKAKILTTVYKSLQMSWPLSDLIGYYFCFSYLQFLTNLLFPKKARHNTASGLLLFP